MLCNLVRINRRIALKSVSIASSIYKVLIQWTPERTVFATGGVQLLALNFIELVIFTFVFRVMKPSL